MFKSCPGSESRRYPGSSNKTWINTCVNPSPPWSKLETMKGKPWTPQRHTPTVPYSKHRRYHSTGIGS
eukprot:1219245-Rhodomonas_salina.1